MTLTIRGGTAPQGGAALCLSCRHAAVVQGTAASHNIIRCARVEARVTFKVESAMAGWNAPPVAPWLEVSMQQASREFFRRDAMYMGTGGSIPFMGMLGLRFPGTQFLITGLLGPKSNAHGPNEFLHIETGKRLTACVARVIADHGRR